jgi:prepilin-type processing-associated H-X9-DG protein
LPKLVSARESIDQDDPALDTVLIDYVNGANFFHCPGDHERLWVKTGTSYFWNSTLNDQMIGNLDFLGLTKQEIGIPMVSDKENFHENIGDEVNILYADGHVQRELQFVVDHR